MRTEFEEKKTIQTSNLCEILKSILNDHQRIFQLY